MELKNLVKASILTIALVVGFIICMEMYWRVRGFTPTWTDEQIALRIQWLPTCTVEAITQTHQHFQDEDVFPDFPKLNCPTLLIYAARARVVTPEMAAEVGRMLSQGRVIGVQAGHMIPWDNLEDFLDVTERFLTERQPPAVQKASA